MMPLGEDAIEFFEKHGSFCRTGNGTIFALEAFSQDRSKLEALVEVWGGSVVKPPPAAPKRWTWRLYGKKAEALWKDIRPHLSSTKQMRGDRKLDHCQNKFGEDA